MIVVCEPTTGLNTLISPCGAGSANCKGLSPPDQRNSSSPFMLQPITLSIISTISTDAPISKTFEPLPSKLGKPQASQPDRRDMLIKLQPSRFM
jgi:hypothetical protein